MRKEPMMEWCLIGMALLAALLGVAALTLRPRRPDLSQVQPGRLLRGCVALVCLGVAAALVAVALLIALR
jgi:hypothetical protein